jgi:23S rRNA (guanosine2251-2'-O)-methyltransferase
MKKKAAIQAHDRKPQKEQRTRGRREMPPVREAGGAGIFGHLPVLELLRADPGRAERVLIADGVQDRRLGEVIRLAKTNGVPIMRVPREKIASVVPEGARHQGVVAIAAAASYADVDDVIRNAAKPSLFVVLDGVEDPRNLGATLRSAECAGVDGVFIPERRAVGLTETVVKTSAGATEYVKVAKAGNLNRLIDELKRSDIWVVGTSAEAEMEYSDWDWTRNSALVLGSEGKGLHRSVAENCDVLVRVPMRGKIESLNVSVAAGVILFEAQRQRSQQTKEVK